MPENSRTNLQATFARYFKDPHAGRNVVAEEELAVLGMRLPSTLPAAYVQFMLEQGPIYCPTILRLTMEFGLEQPDLRQFLTPAEILLRSRDGWKQELPTDLYVFATDCMGNPFCLRRSNDQQDDAQVLFISPQKEGPISLMESFDELLGWYVEHVRQVSAPLKH